MAVSTVTNRVAYQGNGSSAVFSFPYPIHAQSHLSVFIYNSSVTVGGIITPQVLNTDYSVQGTANAQGIYPSGFNIVMNSSPNSQAVMVLFRSSIITNAFAIGQGGPIPSTAINQELDYLTLINQRLQDQVTRAVRLPDGFYGTFDTSLPANLAQSANKRLIVNSTVTGWTFDDTAASYVPNSVIVAATNSSITSLGGAAAGQFLQSQGSSAPTWAAINLSSSTQIAGILPLVNGGTGISAVTQYGLIYASSATQLATVPSALAGLILISNGSSAPSFQTFAATNISSGSISVSFGGTGTATSYIQYGVLFASSATQLANTPAGGTDQPLIGNAGAAPSYQPLNLNSGSSVTGILNQPRGGTGTGTSFIQYGVMFASSATQMANTVAGGFDVPLVGNGAAAPSYRSLSLSSASSINGVLAASYGGTGLFNYGTGDMLFASAFTTMAKFSFAGSSGWILNWATDKPGWTPNPAITAIRSQYIMIGGAGTAGHGTTNTKIRCFDKVLTNVGSIVTYASSAPNGSTFTINEAGLYQIEYYDYDGVTETFQAGLSLNSNQLTTNIASISNSSLLLVSFGSGGLASSVSIWTGALAINDVVRAHTNGLPAFTSNAVRLSITKIGI